MCAVCLSSSSRTGLSLDPLQAIERRLDSPTAILLPGRVPGFFLAGRNRAEGALVAPHAVRHWLRGPAHEWGHGSCPGTTWGTGGSRSFATLPDAGAYLRYASLIGAPICFQSGSGKRKGKRRLEAESDRNVERPTPPGIPRICLHSAYTESIKQKSPVFRTGLSA
jgi:hypothetical protein